MATMSSRCKSVIGPIFGLCSEYLSVVFGVSVLHDLTTSTIAEANIDITRSIFVCSRQRSDYLSIEKFQFHVDSTVCEYRKENLFTMFFYFAPVTAFKQCART